MAQELPIANLSQQLNKARESFDQIKNVSKTLDETVGNTNAKGMAVVTNNIWKSILSYFSKFSEIFFGKTSVKRGQKSTNPLDYGVVYLLSVFSIIDLCSIINAISIVSNNLNIPKFNPNQTPPPDDFKWKVQRLAYDIQVQIDQLLNTVGVNPNQGEILFNGVSSIFPNLEKLISTDYLVSENMRKSYPQVSQMNNLVTDAVSYFRNIGGISNTDKEKINKTLNKINLIRQTCILIQGFTTPMSVSNYAKAALNPSLYEVVDKLGVDNINPVKLKEILSGLEKKIATINKAASFILTYTQYLQFIIKIGLTLVKIFKIIINFMLLLPLPSIVLTAGIHTGLSKGERKLDDYLNNMIKILSEVNLYVSMIVGFLRGITTVLDQIATDIELIIKKLESCKRADNNTNNINNTANKTNQDNTNIAETETIGNLQNLVTELKSINNSFKSFINNYDSKKASNSKTYQGYTIEIKTEDVSDQNVLKTTLPRRYGIALDGSGIQAVRSDLTFASDDNVIINQVKLLLTSKGLVKPQNQVFTNEQLDVLNEAMAAVEDNEISMEDIPVTPVGLGSLATETREESMDAPDNEDENDGLGLNAFVNKLSGGKRLRKRIKESMAKSKEKLNSDISSVKK
jgi:hypothetical protein